MKLFIVLLFISLVSGACSKKKSASRKPNILFMLADDLGWGDLQEHDSEMRTPTITRLKNNGIFLNQSYVMPTCAPTRSSILTGRYPYKFGMQLNTIKGVKMSWLEEDLTLLPQVMKEAGYSTHAVGKWHLGYCNWTVTPTYRGFDSFYGFYGGAQDYFTHAGEKSDKYDFRDNKEVADKGQTVGRYSTELHTERVQKIIRDSRDPFFIYLAYQNVHGPAQARQYYVDKYCSHVEDVLRKTHCAMVAAMDESIDNITQTLKAEGKMDNTILFFLSDNGGQKEIGSINYPLRGQKSTLWEGGTRSFTVISHPSVNRNGETYSGMIHGIDWFPTILEAAGIKKSLTQFDGMPMWKVLKRNLPSPRTEFLYNYDDVQGRLALRWHNYKLTIERPGRVYNGWYPSPSMIQRNPNVRYEEPHKKDVPKEGLYNIHDDPSERENLINDPHLRDTVSVMKEKLEHYKAYLCPYTPGVSSKKGTKLAKENGFVVTPGFCRIPEDSRYKTKCKYAVTDKPPQ